MKNTLSIALFCLIPTSAFALMVHDPQTYAQAIKQLQQTASHHGREISHWQEQINHFKAQNGLLKEQLSGLTGIRELNDIEGELSSLIQEIKGINKHRDALNSMLRSSNDQDSSYTNEILSKYQMFDICKDKADRRLINICKEQILNRAGTIEVGDEIRKQTERKIIEASKIAAKVKNTKDLKESQDLANAIAVKDMEITELKNQWDSFVDESNLRDKLIEQKRQEAFHEQQRNAPSPIIKFKHHER